MANAVAEVQKPEFQDDVRRRKLTIANGTGNVLGRDYVLEKWGLSEAFQVDELKFSAIGTKAT